MLLFMYADGLGSLEENLEKIQIMMIPQNNGIGGDNDPFCSGYNQVYPTDLKVGWET